MGLESGTYIDSLVATNPLGSDNRSQGDDHIRLVKSTVRASFPDVDEAVVTIHNGTSAPSTPQTGTVWRDTTNSLWKFYNGSTWITLAISFNTSNSVDINAGTIDGATINAGTIGVTTPVTDLRVDNIKVDGGTISSTNTNGDLTITPNGTGDIILDGQKWPQADGSNTNYLTTNGSGQTAWTTNTVPTSEANAATSATASATSATASATSATASATSATASQTAQTAAETALDTFDDRMLGAKASAPSVDNDGNALIDGAMFFNTTNDYMMVYNLANTTWYQLTNTTSDQNNINTVAGISSDVTAVAGKATEVGRLGTADAVADMALLGTTACIADMAILGTADIVTDMSILGTADVVSDLNTLATSAIVTDMDLLGTSANVTAMSNCSGSISSINTVSTNVANVNTVGGISANVTTVAGVSGNVTTVAGISANVTTVAGVSSAVSTCATNNANISTTATNIASVNNFASVYRIDSSDPTSSLTEGDLVFRTDTDTMRVYTGSAWQNVAPVSAVNVFGTLAVSGQSNIVADSTTDTLTFAGTGGTTITTNAGTDTITIDTPTAGVSAGFSIAMSIAL